MTTDFSFDYIDTEDYFVILLIAETNSPDQLAQLIKQELSNLEISEADLERKKKTIISSFLFMSDNIYQLNEKAMNNIIKYDTVNCDDYGEITSLNIGEYQKMIPNIQLENHSIYVVLPNEGA